MTASERLRELDEWMPLHSNQSEPRLWELRRALPLIADVVEAAEYQARALDHRSWESAQEIAPLRAALTALREALEKK